MKTETKSPDWRTELKEKQYTLEGNGSVMDSIDAEKTVLLAYSDGMEKGIDMMVDFIKTTDLNKPLDKDELPLRVKEHLEEQLRLIWPNGSATVNPIVD